MARITYTNKTTAATSPLPATQKLTSGDANEIKASVNAAYDQIEEVAGEVAAIVPTYTMIRGLLSQTGTDAPTMTVLENTLGGVPVWTVSVDGDYRMTLSAAFTGSVLLPDNRVLINAGDAPIYARWTKISANVIQLVSYTFPDQDFAQLEIVDMPFTIYVYP